MRFLEELKNLDYFLFLVILLIQVFGVIAVYSATYNGGISPFVYKHLIYIGIGWFLIFLLSFEKLENILDLSLYIYLFNLFLLILVLVAGKEVYGSKRWLSLGFINIQPSEFMKISLILITAYLLPLIKGIKDRRLALLLLVYAIPSVITLKQPDLGTTVAYFVPLFFMLLVRGVPLRYFVLFGFILLSLTPVLWKYFLKPYQKKRILAVIDPMSDYYGSGYQLIQSKIAIGSGMLTGKGLLKGTQTHLMFLPEKHTDFIFAVIGEEFGFIGTFTLSVLFLLLFLRLIYYHEIFQRSYEKLFVAGVYSLILFQFTVNTLMTMGLFPVVGIPLPFVSVGGSSMISFSIAIGLLQNVYKKYKNPYMRLDKEPVYE